MSQLAVLHARSPHGFPDALLSESYKTSYYIPAGVTDAKIAHENVPRASGLPILPPSLESLETSPMTPEVNISGLPPLRQGHPAHVARSRLLQTTMDDMANGSDVESAFFVANLGQVYKQFIRWKRCLPDIEPFYAVKCNPDPYVLRLLAGLGTGFDCASHGEIKQVMDIDVDPSRIIYANPCKSLSFIRHAAKAGVEMMTFDNTDELHKIARVYPAAKLVLRILTDDSKSLCRLGLKFGAPLVTVPALLATARELGLDVVGVSFHVGSGCYDSNAFADAVMRSRAAFDMGAEAGYRFNLLDVGGGFESFNFEVTAGVLSKGLETYFPSAKRDGVRIIAEPGRYFVSSAFMLAANIIARRVSPPETTHPACEAAVGIVECVEGDGETTAEDGNQLKVMYYINDGVYGSFNCIMFDHQTATPYPLTIGRSIAAAARMYQNVGVGTSQDEIDLVPSSVWGPTCDSIDCVAPLTMLPSSLDVGDWLGFDDMGAYTICAASKFNGFDLSEVHYTTGVGKESAAVRATLAMYND